MITYNPDLRNKNPGYT